MACPKNVVDSSFNLKDGLVNAEQLRQRVEAATGLTTEVIHMRPALTRASSAEFRRRRRLDEGAATATSDDGDAVPETHVTLRTVCDKDGDAAQAAASAAAALALDGATPLGATLIQMEEGVTDGTVAVTGGNPVGTVGADSNGNGNNNNNKDGQAPGGAAQTGVQWYVWAGIGVGVAVVGMVSALVVVKLKFNGRIGTASADAPHHAAHSQSAAKGLNLHDNNKPLPRTGSAGSLPPASYV